MQEIIQDILPEVISIRHEIHKKPELKYEEVQTAEFIVAKLKSYGYENIKTKIGKTGVTALIDSGQPGKTVALRADMDALPLDEQNDLPYKSSHPGKMHACGHDGHMATLLGSAQLLKKANPTFKGKIKLIFQPAEEGGRGAKAMIDDGILENPKVDAIFGYHNMPSYKAGKIIVRSGCQMAGISIFKLTINGKGGHAAVPHLADDPIIIGSTIVQQFQHIVSRLNDPVEPLVLSVTQFHAGTADNIIPDSATLTGCVRAISVEMQRKVADEMTKIADGVAAIYNAKAQLEISELYPPTINHPAETQLVIDTARELYGPNATIDMPNPMMVSEDFSYFLLEIPGCFFFVGNGEDRPMCHHPKFNYNDDILPTTMNMMVNCALNYLKT